MKLSLNELVHLQFKKIRLVYNYFFFLLDDVVKAFTNLFSVGL